MTDGCPCHYVSPSSAPWSPQGHDGVSLQLSCHLSYIASWWHHPLSHPIPSQSFLTLAKYTLFLTTRWPPLSPLSPNHQYQKLWPTLFSPPFLILFPFLLLLFCNTHLALIAIRAFKSLQNFSLHMQHFQERYTVSYIPTLQLYIAGISHLCHLTLPICAAFHLVPLSGLLASALTFIL